VSRRGVVPIETQATVLHAADLRVGFPAPEGAVWAVRGVDLSIGPGEIVAIVGESGCGKSLFLRALLRLLPSDALLTGSVMLEGHPVLDADAATLRRLRGGAAGLVFQDPMASLDPLRPIGRQLESAIRAHRPAEATRAEGLRLLDAVQLAQASARYGALPHQLSGGQRQRVGIALALAGMPRLLLADEPTTALDVSVQARILTLLRDLRRSLGMAILLVTHDIGVVSDMAERICVMYAGRLVEHGPAEAVLAHPAHPYARRLLAAHTALDAGARPLPMIAGSPPRPARLVRGCAFAPRCPERHAPCDTGAPPLRGSADRSAECWLEAPPDA
jgi:peptide/nickel transport system ATP-binding protein